MSRNKESEATEAKTSSAPETQSTATIQAKFDKEQEQGFRGTEVDPTPNENYTVAGVTSGAPTPETNVDAAEEVRAATGMGLSGLAAAEREKAAAEAGRAANKRGGK